MAAAVQKPSPAYPLGSRLARRRPPRDRRLRRPRPRPRVRHARADRRRRRHPRARPRVRRPRSPPARDDFEVLFASKAFACTAVMRLMAEEGLACDVAGGGELHMALKAGFDPGRIHLHGNAKSWRELEEALDAGVGHVVLDNVRDIERLEEIVARRRAPAGADARHPGVSPDTHPSISTGRPTRSSASTSTTRAPAIERVMASDKLDLEGLHIHIGSQICRPRAVPRRPIAALADLGDFRDVQPRRRPRRRLHRVRPPAGIEDYVAFKVDAVAQIARAGEADRSTSPAARSSRTPRHALHGRVRQAQRHDLRRGRRRHVRQPAPDALRRALRGPGRRPRRAAASAATSSASTASPATCSSTTPTLADPRAGDVLVTPGDRRLRLRDGEQLQRRPAPAGDLLQGRRRARRRAPRDLRGPDGPRCLAEPFRIGLLGHGTVGAAFDDAARRARRRDRARSTGAAPGDRRRADPLAAATSTTSSSART